MEAEIRLHINFTSEERDILSKAFDILDNLSKLDLWNNCDSKITTNYIKREEIYDAAFTICWLLE